MRNLNQFNEGYKKHNNSERPVYLTFAASKLSDRVKPNTIVEFTDFRGKTHKVAVRNNTEMRKAMAFFSILKRESAKINEILADYPVRMGKIEKKFIPQVKRELKSIGLTPKAIKVVLG